MFKLWLLFVLCFGFLPIKSFTDSTRIRIGVKAGLGVSCLTGVPVYSDKGFSNNSGTAGMFAFSIDRKLNRYFSFGSELLLGFRGGQFNEERDSVAAYAYWVQNGMPINNTAPTYSQNHKLTTLDLPLYVKASFTWRKISPFISGGIVPSYVLYYRYEWNEWYDNSHINELDSDLISQMNRFTTGLMASAGCRNKWWSAEVRYNYFGRCDVISYGEKLSPQNHSLLLVLSAEIRVK